jgi:hypothetical protein
MKSLLKFLGVLLVLFIWVEMVNLSFYLMNQSDTYVFYIGILSLALVIVGPILYFADNIEIFVRNMKGVFFDKEEKK